jgi:quinol monooxygenase YgiN
MTILIAGTIDINAENRDRALADAATLMADTRSQQGCVHYVWSADPTSPTRIYVYEYWDSTADLAAHLADPSTPGCWPCWASTARKMPRSPSLK